MGTLQVKGGVDFGPSLAPAGARILEALKQVVEPLDFNLTITSARDGVHSGPADPHHSGEAFDVRSNTFQLGQKLAVLTSIRQKLYREPRRFYAFLEDAGGPNEHFHIQRRAGTSYSTLDYLQNL
jgi:hypothetical protein